MKQGFVKVAAASCAVVVADVRENTRVILETIHKMEGEGAKVMVLPELALTGYTCSDLFWQRKRSAAFQKMHGFSISAPVRDAFSYRFL